jgi:tRNA/tmRNA/rRNA uracil-C5-methylase (TrmA/RlmC/RlmD family)
VTDTLTLDILQPVAGGRMLARHDGRVVLVAGAIPGERVTVRVERATRQMIWATVIGVDVASPDRRDPGADPSCGGRAYAHIAGDRQRELKALVVADAFRRIGKLTLATPPAVAPSPETGYRLRARLHVGRGRAGFYREGTHSICDAGATGQLSPGALSAVDHALAALGARIAECAAIVVAENIPGTEQALHLVPQPGARLAGLPGAPPGASFVTEPGASIYGGDVPALAAAVVRRAAPSFFQANRFLTPVLARRVVEVANGDRVVDLYSGVGLFAVGLAARGARVLAVEGDAVSFADLEVNAAPWPDRLKVARMPVEGTLADAAPAGLAVAIVDPPRPGLSPEALTGLLGWAPPRVVYVSCDPPTLARDARQLIAGGYALTSIECFDFFPGTPHVESLAVFDRTR